MWKEYKVVIIPFIFIFALIGYKIYEEVQFIKECNKLGGQAVKTYRSSFVCVKDPNILKVK